MKFNKWTLGLAAVGVVSLASAAKADEKMTAIQTALSSTTISGYVDTSVQWNPGTGNSSGAPVAFQGPGKADGFNLNVVQLTIAKPLDESEWASGYRADFWFGPDANSLGSQSIFASGGKASRGDIAIRQAYVALRTPVGNGIDWKIGVFDTVIGYESLESGNNPHYTRSYGFTVEPTTHTGLLGTYRATDWLSFSAGIANTIGPSINERAQGPNATTPGTGSVHPAESAKTYMGSIALTAPQDWGWAAGSTLYAGIVNGFNSGVPTGGSSAVDNQMNLYVGGTLATPVAGLKVGAAFDYVKNRNFLPDRDELWTLALYGSYQASEKLSLHLRGEMLNAESGGTARDAHLYAITATAQYDLWQNVISRVEFRWDHADLPGGIHAFGGRQSSGHTGDDAATSAGYGESHSLAQNLLDVSSESGVDAGRDNALMIALQIIYKF